MIRCAGLLAVSLVFATGCGDDDDAGPAGGATGATGASRATAPYDITVGEFVGEIRPEKQRILRAFVADSEVCTGTRVNPSFVLLVSAASIDADQDAALGGLVEKQC